MIKNAQVTIKKSELVDARALPSVIENSLGRNVLRYYIAEVTKDELVLETTTCTGEPRPISRRAELRSPSGKSAVLSVVPTGVGCRIGGYAGDASPITNLLAGTADYLITNPNAVNASDFIGLGAENIVYTDGYAMDLFCKGLIDLRLPYSNRIGVIVETAEDWKLDMVFNLINTVRAVHGVNIVDYVITDRPIGGRCVENSSRAFVGVVDNPEVLYEACERLTKNGANAIAITSNIQDIPLENYARHFDGNYANPVGGVEAIISYVVSSRYHLPTAHAPMINIRQLDLKHNVVDARGAGEMVSGSGLACILLGLRKAPQISESYNYPLSQVLTIDELLAVIMPANCLGGIPAIFAQNYNIPIITIADNQTVLDVTQSKLGLSNVVEARSYTEAAGLVIALKRGISLESLTRPLKTIRYRH
jgi:hypothetical protein